jgi:hypothetical protein
MRQQPAACPRQNSVFISIPMTFRRSLFLALALCYPAISIGQIPAPDTVSSDDISVADGLQLPVFGHVWIMDTWKNVKELVQLHRPDDAASDHGFTVRVRHIIELRGEAAAIRIHDRTPQIFIRGVSGDDNGESRSDFALIRVNVIGDRREAAKQAVEEISAKGREKGIHSPEVIELTQRRIGSTDWYRLTAQKALEPGEYFMVPWAGTTSAALDEIYDFAFDPEAPENIQAVRSEEDRSQ